MNGQSTKIISIPIIVITFGVIIFLGYLIGNYSIQLVEKNARSAFLTQTRIAALSIDPNVISDLSGSQSDLNKSSYQYVRDKLRDIKRTSSKIRFVYLMVSKLDGVHFLVDAEPAESEDYSPPGQLYENPSDELLNIFTTGKAFVEGPITDTWGTWISGHALITHENAKMPIIIGIDINADTWQASRRHYFWASTGITGLLILLSIIYFISIFRGRKNLEEKESNALLLQKTVDKLNLSNQALDAFSSAISHDLRAPLRHIDGYLKIIEEDYSDQIDNDGIDYIDKSRTCTDRMNSMINSLLVLSKISAESLNKTPINLSELMRELLNQIEYDNQSIKITVLDTPTVVADPRLLRVALTNLVENSLKYTSKTERPVIEFGSIQEGNTVTFYLRDNGCGFNMKYASKLFTEFQRLHKQYEYEGTGIGLSTVQRVIHRHGGKVWAEGEEGKGATFYFTVE